MRVRLLRRGKRRKRERRPAKARDRPRFRPARCEASNLRTITTPRQHTVEHAVRAERRVSRRARDAHSDRDTTAATAQRPACDRQTDCQNTPNPNSHPTTPQPPSNERTPTSSHRPVDVARRQHVPERQIAQDTLQGHPVGRASPPAHPDSSALELTPSSSLEPGAGVPTGRLAGCGRRQARAARGEWQGQGGTDSRCGASLVLLLPPTSELTSRRTTTGRGDVRRAIRAATEQAVAQRHASVHPRPPRRLYRRCVRRRASAPDGGRAMPYLRS